MHCTPTFNLELDLAHLRPRHKSNKSAYGSEYQIHIMKIDASMRIGDQSLKIANMRSQPKHNTTPNRTHGGK